MKNKMAKFMALLLAAVLLVGCGANSGGENSGGTETKSGGDSQGTANGEKIVTLASTGAWEALHPFSSERDTQVAFIYPIYESYVTITSEGEVLPRLFESWEQSEDGSVLTCKLRQDATWSDGEPVTAHDVEFTLKTATDPNLPVDGSRPQVTMLFTGTDDVGARIEGEEFGVKALDDYTVEFTYKDSKKSTILNEMYSMRYTFTLPEHCLKDIPVESLLTDSFWENPVTSGAFTVDNIISGERIEYAARDDYYLGRPQMDRLMIRVIPANNILSAMLAGEVDGTVYGSQLTYSDYELAKKDENLETFETSGFGNYHLLLNNEALDQNARLAIDCAVNKESIINDVLYGYARPAISAIVPENPYRNKAVEGNPYDPELAKEYLAKSSLDTSKPLRLLIGSSSVIGQNIAVLVQQQLQAIGLTVNIEPYDTATLSSKFYEGDFEMGFMGAASNPFEPSESLFYFRVVPNGWLRMTDDSWVKIYEKGIEGLTLEERKPAYDELQERLVAEVPMVFLYHPDMLFVNSKKISGMPYADFSLKSWRYEEWTVK